MAKIDTSKYDYIIFVDASGDDGIQFENGSSLCFTTACFISKVEDLEDNAKVLNRIKQITDRLPENELKHSTLRRHKKYLTALKEFDNIKGSIAVHNSFKKDLLDDVLFKNPSTKLLSSFTHYFPLSEISKNETLINGNVLICIDRMKEIEMDTVRTLTEDLKQESFHGDDYEVTFRDSKASGYELIQIADVIAGIWRTFFEESITNQSIVNFTNSCRYCWLSSAKGKWQYFCNSKSVKSIRNMLLNKPIKHTLPSIIRDNSGSMLFRGIVAVPLEKVNKYIFLECTKKR